MKRHKSSSCLLPIIAFILFAVFATVVFAHPGRTDSNGGHYNRSTGEYHYHDGLSAGKSGGDSASEEYYYNSDYLSRSTVKTATPSPTPTPINVSVPLWAKWILLLISIGLLVCLIVALSYKREIKRLEAVLEKVRQQHIQEHNQLSSMVKCDLSELWALFASAYGDSFLATVCGMPDGENIGIDNLPYTDDYPLLKWGSKYTFYFNYMNYSSGSIPCRRLHTPSCRYAAGALQVNAYEIKQKNNIYIPCQICKPSLPDMEWVDNYNKYQKIFTEHYEL